MDPNEQLWIVWNFRLSPLSILLKGIIMVGQETGELLALMGNYDGQSRIATHFNDQSLVSTLVENPTELRRYLKLYKEHSHSQQAPIGIQVSRVNSDACSQAWEVGWEVLLYPLRHFRHHLLHHEAQLLETQM